MFTGIIQEVGKIQSINHYGSSAEILIYAPAVCKDANLGDSICTNGVCLTAVHIAGGCFKADVSQETLTRSTLLSIKQGDAVNLEPSLRPYDRMGGHIVSGHVDAVGSIAAMDDLGDFINLTIKYPKPLAPFIAEKGSIAIDGISLTVTQVTDETFGAALVPYTIQQTNMQHKQAGSTVNIEADVIARYVQRMLSVGGLNHGETDQGVSMETLHKHGFLTS